MLGFLCLGYGWEKIQFTGVTYEKAQRCEIATGNCSTIKNAKTGQNYSKMLQIELNKSIKFFSFDDSWHPLFI